MSTGWRLALGIVAALTVFVPRGWSEEEDPPEVAIGERLFLETRFTQFFFANSNGNVNAVLKTGDPALKETVTLGQAAPGPFAGKSMNCRACHLVDEHKDTLGNRTYSDFARRAPIPARADGLTHALRNSQALVTVAPPGGVTMLLHHDGEFATPRDLVKATYTGRNFGWLPGEQAQARAHLAKVIREDDGRGELAQEFGGSYYQVFKAEDPAIPAKFRLPEKFRADIGKLNDEQILDAVVKIVVAYLDSLRFQTDEAGEYSGSPYDVFLKKNKLPRKPAAGQSPASYAAELDRKLSELKEPDFVTSADGKFKTFKQPFLFGYFELQGMQIFLQSGGKAGGSGASCFECHTPPHFTDFRFHNTGAAQEEYDAVHGSGKFAALLLPTLEKRNAHREQFLPPNEKHPNYSGTMAAIPRADAPRLVDLGVWNVFANPDVRGPQEALKSMLNGRSAANTDTLLERAVGAVRTPSLRGLNMSAPYLHTGRKDTIEDVLRFYVETTGREPKRTLRNAPSGFRYLQLRENDIAPLAAFLRALNEDYE